MKLIDEIKYYLCIVAVFGCFIFSFTELLALIVLFARPEVAIRLFYAGLWTLGGSIVSVVIAFILNVIGRWVK